MSSAGKAVTTVNAAEALGAAREYLSRLANCPDEAEALAEDCCRRYSWAARRDIFEQIAEEVSRRSVDIPAGAWHCFLTFSSEGLKANKVAEHLEVILRLALAASKENGAAVAGRLLFEQIKPVAEGAKPRGHLGLEDEHILCVADLERAGAVVVAVLRQAEQSSALNRAFLARWQRALALVIGRTASARRRALNAEQANEVLASLGRLQQTDLPDELLLFCPRLVALAGPNGAAFFETAVGKLVGELLPSGSSPVALDAITVVAASQEPAPPAAPVAEWEAALWKARELIQTEMRRLEQAAGATRELAETRGRLKAAQEESREAIASQRRLEGELTGVREHLEKVSAQVADLEHQRLALTDRLHEAEQNVARRQGEAGRREAELTAGFEDQGRRDVERLRQLFAGNARELCEYMREVLAKHRGDNLVRKMGVVFDQLHRDLLTVLQQPNEQRLPRELLSRTDQESRRDEQQGN